MKDYEEMEKTMAMEASAMPAIRVSRMVRQAAQQIGNKSSVLVLLELASHVSDDNGSGIYLSMATIARRTCMTPQGVRKVLRRLEAEGYVVTTHISGRVNQYRIVLSRLAAAAEVGTEMTEPASPSAAPAQEPQAQAPDTSPTPAATGEYITAKGRKLTGCQLLDFLRFWNAYKLDRAKAEAADAWMDIPGLAPDLAERIITAARAEAERRTQNQIPADKAITAPRWLGGRRWEDDVYRRSPASPAHVLASWQKDDTYQAVSPEEAQKRAREIIERTKRRAMAGVPSSPALAPRPEKLHESA